MDLSKSADHDCIVAIEDPGLPKNIAKYVADAKAFDKAFSSEVSCFKCDGMPIVYAAPDFSEYSDGKDSIERLN